MAQIINTNVASLTAQRHLNESQGSLRTALERLSSGLRVNSAKDDAAGMAIASRMNAQVKGMNVAIRNANDAISLSQTAEGAISKVGDMLQRMRELSVQSANATNGVADRSNLDAEYQALGSEIGRVLANTKFNGIAIVGAGAGALTFQVGADATDTISVTTTNLAAAASVTAVTATGVTTAALATAAIGLIDTAMTTVNGERANYGATQNRFESVVGTLQVSAENQAAARSRIMDADFASETANLTRGQILQQAGTAMLAQANALPNSVLSLLK